MQPTSTTRSLVLMIVAVPMLLIAACTDTIVAPPTVASKAARAARNLADPGSSATCASIVAAHPGSADGNYAVQGAGGSTFVVYCNSMAGTPAEYLTLSVTGPGKNFGSWAGEYQHSGGPLVTSFTRLRIDPAALQVDNNDFTFSSSINVPTFGPGQWLYMYPFASAGDCLGGAPQGTANVDLNGTPFSINDVFLTDGWFPSGSVNGTGMGWGVTLAVQGKTADLTGGGFCGGTTPNTRPGYLQLAFTGPALSSPIASLTAPSTANEGDVVSLTATASHPAGVPFWTTWDLGDGTAGTGAMPASHVYADDGSYTVTFTAYDGATTPAVATQVIAVANVPPAVSAIPSATIFVGETYSAAGTFTDPGPGSHSATVDYGTGAGPLVLSGNSFALSHLYGSAGVFTATVTVTDDDMGAGSSSATVTVLSSGQAAQYLGQIIAATLSANDAKPLIVSLDQVAASLDRGNTNAASGQLGAFDNKLQAALDSGKITAATYAVLAEYSRRIRASMG